MRRLVAVALVLSLVPAGIASASHRDPERKIAPADQVRARSMLLRRSDLGYGYQVTSSGAAGHVDCAALDESDLTLTGEAQSSVWARDVSVVSSYANVYASVADANASWRRQTSAAGRRCAAKEFQRLAGASGARLLSLRVLSFPRLAPRTVAVRVVFLLRAQAPRLTIDLVVLQRSRAQAFFSVASALVAPPSSEELRLAKIVARRLATAMRRS